MPVGDWVDVGTQERTDEVSGISGRVSLGHGSAHSSVSGSPWDGGANDGLTPVNISSLADAADNYGGVDNRSVYVYAERGAYRGAVTQYVVSMLWLYIPLTPYGMPDVPIPSDIPSGREQYEWSWGYGQPVDFGGSGPRRNTDDDSSNVIENIHVVLSGGMVWNPYWGQQPWAHFVDTDIEIRLPLNTGEGVAPVSEFEPPYNSRFKRWPTSSDLASWPLLTSIPVPSFAAPTGSGTRNPSTGAVDLAQGDYQTAAADIEFDVPGDYLKPHPYLAFSPSLEFAICTSHHSAGADITAAAMSQAPQWPFSSPGDASYPEYITGETAAYAGLSIDYSDITLKTATITYRSGRVRDMGVPASVDYVL